MTKTKIDKGIVITGIIGLTAAELMALAMGYNGTLLKMFMIIVAIAVGVTIPLDKFVKIK